jgi:uncharacterized protein involved in exopolysaccharide biosynthesis
MSLDRGHSVEFDDDEEVSLLELLFVLIDNFWLLLLAPVFAGALAVAHSYTVPLEYSARSVISTPSPTGSMSALAAISNQLGGRFLGLPSGLGSDGVRYSLYLDSDQIRKRVIDKFELQKHWSTKSLVQAQAQLKEAVKISDDPKKNAIIIEVTTNEAKLSSDIANYYVEALETSLNEQFLLTSRRTREVLEAQISEILQKPYKSTLVRDSLIQGLIQQSEQNRLNEQLRQQVTIIDPAVIPTFKSGPNRVKAGVISAFGCLVVVIIFVFVRHAVRTSQKLPKNQAIWDEIRRSLRRILPFVRG